MSHTGVADIAASFEDTLTAVLDDATYNGDAVASAGEVSVEGDLLSWTGDLAAGDVVTVTYSVTVTGGGDDVLTNVVRPTAPGGVCIPAPDGNADCTTTHEIGGFTVSKTSDPAPGSQVVVGEKITYTVTVAHTGVADLTAAFTDTLTDVLDDARYDGEVSATMGTATVTGSELAWSGDLSAGDVVTVTYSVTVHGHGDDVLTNLVVPVGVGGAPAWKNRRVGLVGVTVDEPNRNGWCGYWTTAAARGRGWTARAAATVADWALTTRGLHRLELGHRVTNPASGRVARRAGFVVEGREREKFLVDGRRVDVITYGRLATDPAPAYDPLPMSGASGP